MSKLADPVTEQRVERHIPTPSELEAQQGTQIIEEKAIGIERGDDNSLREGSPNTMVVDWDGESDPTNPMNWSKTKRISQVVLVSAITMVTLVHPLISSLSQFAK
jgi:hypothetical protein